ncbi:MAG TPA: SulP family inorganic anion transporter [Allosphingosinicella sp.]|nr:SulP family inorganic anion transporter [Allosphingosinicella sp.]
MNQPGKADLGAGLAVAALMLPEAVAYAGIAGLPPARGLVSAIAGCLVYAAIGRSRFAIVSPTSSAAAILAAALAALAPSSNDAGGLATLAVLLVGIIFLAASLLRLGALASFVSRPVVRGFAFGLAITITLRQLPALLGIPADGAGLGILAARLVEHLPAIDAATAATGVAALMALLALRRVPAVPGALLVLLGGIAASLFLGLPARGVATVGRIPLHFAPLALPIPDWGSFARLVQLVVPLVLILFSESWGTIRTLALRHGDDVRPGRELAALGAANLAAGLLQGLPVGAGFSAGSANEAAGAKSRWAAVVAPLAMAAALVAAMPWIALLPRPVLAAVVIAALAEALKPAPLLRLWRLGRDQYVAAAAAIGVLALGIVNGMLLAIALSIAAMVRRMAAQDVVRLGRLPGTHDFVDLARHKEAEASPDVAIWRPAEPLFFANAEAILGLMSRETPAGAGTLIVSLEESSDLDGTALEALVEFDERMDRRGHRVLLARVRDSIRDLLRAADAADLAGRCYYSVADAADAAAGGRPKS